MTPRLDSGIRRALVKIPLAITLLGDLSVALAQDAQPSTEPPGAAEDDGAPAESPPSPSVPAEPPAISPTAPPTQPTPLPPPAPAPQGLPDFMRSKRRMRDEDVVRKTERGNVTGLPLWTSDPDTGIGLGARLVYLNNGLRTDPMFAFTPYRHRVSGQAFFTTNGYQYHAIDYDAPYIFDSPFRLRASVYFEKNIAANYFGIGTRTLGRLSFPGEDRKFDSVDEYTDALRQKRADGTAFTRYDQYILERPSLGASLERDIFGGVVRALVGFTTSYVSVDQWTGRTVSADEGRSEVEARQTLTRLDDDCRRGLLVGCNGGFNNALKLGLAFDTRDFEPDPNSGLFIELATEVAGRPLGSDFDWARVTLSPRAYFSPFPKLTDLVIAGRLVGSVKTDDTPFFAMPELSFTDRNLWGLGGLRTIRGFKQNRFVGRAVAMANLEVRWTFWELAASARHRFAFMLVPFVDVGRVFDTIDDFELRRFRNGQGAGLRIAWNQANITVFDYGISREGSTFYVSSTHPF